MTKAANIAVILLAAGRSSRMRGADKLLQIIDNQTLLERQAQICLASRARHSLVVLGPDQATRKKIAQESGINLIIASDAQNGMSASLKAGVQSVPEGTEAVIILPADMPEITAQDLDKLIEVYLTTGAEIVRGATKAGAPGHPVLLDKALFSEIMKLTGDQGARPILAANRSAVQLVTLEDERALLDLDTPEDWANWRSTAASSAKSPR